MHTGGEGGGGGEGGTSCRDRLKNLVNAIKRKLGDYPRFSHNGMHPLKIILK
jgi:hypothetical protein